MIRKLAAFALALLWLGACQPEPVFAQANVIPPPVPVVVSGSLALVGAGPVNLALLGDSITASADPGLNSGFNNCPPACQSGLNSSYITWMAFYSNYNLFRSPSGPTNFGESGDITSQILARVPQVIQSGANIVLLQGGTNDAATNVSCATITANFLSMYQQFQQARITVVKVGLYPRPSFTTAQANVAQCVNQFDRNYARNNQHLGFYFFDLDPVVVDPTQASWAIKASYIQPDNTHLTQIGSSAVGYALAQAFYWMGWQWLYPDYTAANLYDAANNPRGNLINSGYGQFTGTTGTPSAPCTTTAGLATGWQVFTQGGTTGSLTCVLTKTSMADGRTCQVLTLGGTYSGAPNIIVQIASFTYANLSVGDIIEGLGYVQYTGGVNISGIDLILSTTENATAYYYKASSPNQTYIGPANYANNSFVPLLTPRRTIQYVPTAMTLAFYVELMNQASSSSAGGVITFCSASVRKVIQ